MINRILQIMKQENVSASKFADDIGVQRSSISHILSERNKPSLELIQKILNKYPKVNPEWLLTGKFTVLNEQADLFTQNQTDNIKNNNDKPKEGEINQITNVNKDNLQIDDAKLLDEDTNVNSIEKETTINENRKFSTDNQVITKKNIERIIVFYSDKTFKEYSPE